ncbi:hypothetical protein CTEN210_14797 [Chaetoceros tenuissimus]|uniref:RanBP2-type domain-containing protein n=1 Tax=Chaetoceros tenuissimus TaxID=426638 RepID=A0AAD3HCM1_9STRA|nr:hypothetical protein CTEN210_14797 [Chaetoceros tenuissimus]
MKIVSLALKKQSMSHQVPKAAANTSNDTAAVSLPPPSQGWGNLFKKEEGTWACLICRSSNPKTASSCLACKTAKGKKSVGEKPSEEDAGNDKKDDDSKGPTFCFDNKDSGNTFTFSYGAPASDAANSNASGGFTFGAANTENSKGDTLKPATGGFTFETAKKKDSKGNTPKPATSGFTFVATSTAATEKKDDTPKPTF